MEIINFIKIIKPLTEKEQQSYTSQGNGYIWRDKFKERDADDEKYAPHSMCNLKCIIPKEMPVIFHNGSIYHYHFITKQLAEEFERVFICLGEGKEKYITFSFLIKKEIKKEKKKTKDKIISNKLKFIDSIRFIASSLSNLNLAEGIHIIKCKYGHANKTCETCGTKYKDWSSVLNTQKLTII